MCGIVGMVGHDNVGLRLYDALTVLQHRGQDAAGIATADRRRLNLRKANGLVRDVFNEAHMQSLVGTMGIAHCRYPTAGTPNHCEAQPFYVNTPFGICLAHNGNLTNADVLARDLFNADLRHLNTNSDSEVLLNVFAHELGVALRGAGQQTLTPDDVFSAVSRVHSRCRGAYAAVAMITGYGVVGFRDPYGIRPLCYGRRTTAEGTEYVLASESVAMDALGFERVADVNPGEAVYIEASGRCHVERCAAEPRHCPCIFEHVYLARPDSILDQCSVYKARLHMGEKLAAKILRQRPDHDIDVVMPIPDSGRTAAAALARTLRRESRRLTDTVSEDGERPKYREGFIKNRYIGRTFIMPGQAERRKSVRRKLNPIGLEFKDKVVLLVDDSIVRGTTCQEIVQMARDAGARKVYYASAAPPIRYPNVYGIDMPAAEELIAHGLSEEQVQRKIGADWLVYQDLPDLIDACLHEESPVRDFETSVFTGTYITGDIDDAYLERLYQSRNDLARQRQHAEDRRTLWDAEGA